MSVDVIVYIVCDGEDCERCAETHTDLETMAYLRCNEHDWAEVRNGKWVNGGWRHYCPTCAEQRGLELGQSVKLEDGAGDDE